MIRKLASLAVWLVAAGTVVSVAAGAARLTWHMAGLFEGTPAGRTAPQSGGRAPAPTDLEPILALAPFGIRVKIEEQTEPLPVAEQTSLDLVLRGVLVAEPNAASMAYIAGGDGVIGVYGIGTPVVSGAVLSEVHRDRVVLEIDGRLEILSFEDGVDAASAAADAVRARIQGRLDGPLPEEGATPDEAIEFWRRRIAENPQGVLDQLGLEITDEGYRIGEAAHPGVRRAGFLPGDLVASVNGEPIGNIEDDRALYDRVAASGRARVELVRDGQTIVMSFPLR